MEDFKPKLLASVQKLPDFYLELKWEFSSWVPLLSRVLPGDTCRLYKKDCLIRMDATLLDFNARSLWNRGDLSYFCDCRTIDDVPVVVVDRQKKVFQHLKPEISEAMLQKGVDRRLRTDVTYSRISTKPITLEQSRKGWLWRGDRVDNIGGYSCPVYNVHGVTMVSQRRTEHLPEKDARRIAKVHESLHTGDMSEEDEGSSVDEDDKTDEAAECRHVLPPPPLNVSFSQYINGQSKGNPPVGRKPRVSEVKRHFQPVVALCSDFPIPTEFLVELLEFIAPYRHFQKLRDLVKRLPQGFPMRVEVPVFPTITAKVTFHEFELRKYDGDSLFTVPPDFVRGQVFDLNQQ